MLEGHAMPCQAAVNPMIAHLYRGFGLSANRLIIEPLIAIGDNMKPFAWFEWLDLEATG